MLSGDADAPGLRRMRCTSVEIAERVGEVRSKAHYVGAGFQFNGTVEDPVDVVAPCGPCILPVHLPDDLAVLSAFDPSVVVSPAHRDLPQCANMNGAGLLRSEERRVGREGTFRGSRSER